MAGVLDQDLVELLQQQLGQTLAQLEHGGGGEFKRGRWGLMCARISRIANIFPFITLINTPPPPHISFPVVLQPLL